MRFQGDSESDPVEIAMARFQEGYVCSQAVLAAYAPLFDLPSDLALRLASGFGGGMARMGEACGAVTGALMVIGLKYGNTRPEDTTSKETTYRLMDEYVQRFKARNGSIDCRDLLGCAISTPEGLRAAREAGLFETVCPKLVWYSAEIVASILERD